MPDAAAIGSSDVSADEVIERRVASVADTCFDSGDSGQDAWRSSSDICGVNYTGIGELERRAEGRLSYWRSRSTPRTVPEYDVDMVLQKLAFRLVSLTRS
jgi:hypothetical protein